MKDFYQETNGILGMTLRRTLRIDLETNLADILKKIWTIEILQI